MLSLNVRLGLQMNVPQNENEQSFVDLLNIFGFNWLRIKLDSNEIYTDDKFQGESLCMKNILDGIW